nr:hypothetical protein [uncultured Rhodopila sp.]
MLSAGLAASGCMTPTPEQQAGALTLQAGALDSRQVQARRYDMHDEQGLMAATLGVLQDLGYTVNETSAGAGMISASKDRQGARIRVSVVVRPSADRAGMIARVSFQAISAPVFGQQPQIETITDNAVYQQFFERLSQSLFLEAHQI